jgi:hypothetical protein
MHGANSLYLQKEDPSNIQKFKEFFLLNLKESNTSGKNCFRGTDSTVNRKHVGNPGNRKILSGHQLFFERFPLLPKQKSDLRFCPFTAASCNIACSFVSKLQTKGKCNILLWHFLGPNEIDLKTEISGKR